jgi:hypothetical protein
MRGASHDVWVVNTDYEYHEEQKVEPDTSKGAPPARVGTGSASVVA